MADYEATPDMIGKMKKGQVLIVQAINSNRQPITLPVPLADFAKAYDGPPTDPKVFEAAAAEVAGRAATARRRRPQAARAAARRRRKRRTRRLRHRKPRRRSSRARRIPDRRRVADILPDFLYCAQAQWTVAARGR